MARAVYVYQGLGISDFAYKHLYRTLQQCLADFSISPITPYEIISDDKLESAALVAFGGGFASGFIQALGETGIDRLKSYVQNGGSFLGIGAGGYFGCDFVEFDKGGPLEKVKELELRFYPGICQGPAYPGFEYGTMKGVHAAPIHFKSNGFESTFNAYLDGGGKFTPCTSKLGSKVTEVNVIASFTDIPEKPAAIVHTRVGNGGRVILSGVHLEFDTLSIVDSDPTVSSLESLFHSGEESQQRAFKVLLELLGLNPHSGRAR